MSPINHQPGPEPIEPARLEQRFAQRLEELRAALAATAPERIAGACGADIRPVEGSDAASVALHLAYWNRSILITWPEWVAFAEGEDQPLSAFEQALVLYYLTSADGTPLSGEWIAFSDLPDGRFYSQAFQSYTGKELARAFQEDGAAFERAAQALGGVRQALGEAAFAFQALPRVPLLTVYWQGDEDFPSTFQVLFDASASHYLPTDGYAILGSTLTRKLIKARR